MHRILLLLALFLVVTPATAQVERRPFLFKDARGELAAARVREASDVLLVIAAMPGANARVSRRIAGLGGTIRFRDDDVDYLRARLPVDSVEKLVSDPDVHSADVSISGTSRAFGLASHEPDRARSIARVTTLQSPPQQRVWPPVLPDYPLTNRYDPLTDMNGMRLRSAHPTFDGRGVGVAIIDQSLDPLLPELQTAMTIDGRPVRKIFAYQSVTDMEDEPDGRWLKMEDTVAVAGSTFTWKDSTYTAPRAGRFRIAHFDEAVFDSLSRARIDKDVNRDGNPEGSSRLFGVLWDEQSNDVWVDTDQDLSFADEKALTDYSVRPEFGVFGTDKPETPVRESIAFGVETDRAGRKIALNLGQASHASLVVGAVVASRGQAGRFDGVAPGARLANVAEGGAAYGQTEALIVALKHPDVDVAFLEQSSVITRNYLLRDGRLVPTVIYARLIEKLGKSIIIPTHNYPILGGIDDFVNAKGAIGIGGHESASNFFANHGVRVPHDDNLLITGGYGPMGDGALKPDVIAPSNYISTRRGFEDPAVMEGLYQLPPGYMVAGGTSTATPTATGAIALLISAARQTGIRHDPQRIKHAVTMSARYIPHIPAYKQGNGIVDIGAAWTLLQALNDRELIEIDVRAPVRHLFSHLLPAPNEGVGIYERDGWAAGDRAGRTIMLTRKNGPRQPLTFALSWVGNEAGTFSTPSSVVLPLDRPVPVVVTIAPEAAGAHSALLTLDHPDVPGHALRMLAAIVAAERLTAENGFTIERKTEVPRPGIQSFFYDVPANVNALRIDLDAPKRRVAVAVARPDTRNQSGIGAPAGAGKSTWVINDPMPGLWEIRLSDVDDTRTFDRAQADKDEPVPPTPATLTVTALAADVTVSNAMLLDRATNAIADADVTVVNRMGEFSGGTAGMSLGSARRERQSIRDREQQVYEVDVLPGATLLMARAGNTTDTQSDLDLYVFDCTGRECRPARADGDLHDDETVYVQNPASGKWKIVVDGASVPAGSTSYDYLDVFFSPLNGMLAVADSAGKRERDTTWTARSHAWTAAAFNGERVPFPALLLQTRGQGNDRLTVRVVELAGDRRVSDGGTQPQ